MADLYKVQSRTADPLDDLMKAVLALNWHLMRSEQQGWDVGLSINDESGCVAVLVARKEWPTPFDDAEQA